MSADSSSSAKKPRLEAEKEAEKHGKAPLAAASSAVSAQLLEIEGAMCRELGDMDFGPPITHIYNPLDYASNTHSHYVGCYGNSEKRVLFIGMNPGPFGMAQNGVSVQCCGESWR